MSNSTSSNNRPPASVEIRHLIPIFLWVIAVVLFLRFFEAFRIIALGFLAASIVASALRPLKRLFPGPRWWSAFLAAVLPMLLVVLFIILASWLLADPIRREVARLPEIRDQIDNQLGYWSTRLGLQHRVTLGGILSRLGSFFDHGVLATTTTLATDALLAAVFLTFGSLYLLGEKPDHLLAPILKLLPPQRRPQLRSAVLDLEPRLRWWLIGSLIAMGATGLATWIGYSLIGLQFAGPLALLAGLAEIVPTFGPVMAFLLALLFAAAKGGTSIIGIIIVYMVIQGLESYVLQPFVMKQAVSMPPVVTLFTIILWSQVFGVPGLMLAIPINLVIWVLIDHFLLRPDTGVEPPLRET